MTWGTDDCEHAQLCDKCNIYLCANDRLVSCKGCGKHYICYKCIKPKGVLKLGGELHWFCDWGQYRIEKGERCSICKKNLNTFAYQSEEHGMICRRCTFYHIKGRDKKL